MTFKRFCECVVNCPRYYMNKIEAISDKKKEVFFSRALYILMIIVFVLLVTSLLYPLVIEPPKADEGRGILIDGSIFIAISALMASIAMSRSVYATKVSDKKKLDRELHTERLDIYANFMTHIMGTSIKGKYKKETESELFILLAKSKVLFPSQDVNSYIEKSIKIMHSLNSSTNKRSNQVKEITQLEKTWIN